jgi:hypothetical protein
MKARYAGQPQPSGRAGGLVSGKGRTKKAGEFANSLAPLIAEAREAGCVSSTEIADYLNVQGIRAPRGGLWSRQRMRQLLARLDA